MPLYVCNTHHATQNLALECRIYTRFKYQPHKSRFLSAALCAPHTQGDVGAKSTTSAKTAKKRLLFYQPHKAAFLGAALCAPHTPGDVGPKTTTSAKPAQKRLFNQPHKAAF